MEVRQIILVLFPAIPGELITDTIVSELSPNSTRLPCGFRAINNGSGLNDQLQLLTDRSANSETGTLSLIPRDLSQRAASERHVERHMALLTATNLYP